MARKKSRPAPDRLTAPIQTVGSAGSTAVVAQANVTGITKTPNARSTVTEPRREETPFLTTPTGRFLKRSFRLFSSLRLALVLLPLFTLALILATVLESKHNAEIAQQLVYRAWWFILLLFLLGTNILCAALSRMDPKKLAAGSWPWKKYHTGFLVTHLGLITLVFGGLLTALGGEEGQIAMADTEDVKIQEELETPQTTGTLRIIGESLLAVSKVPNPAAFKKDPARQKEAQAILDTLRSGGTLTEEERTKVPTWSLPFSPGAFPWHEEGGYRSNMPWGLRLLTFVASPVKGFSRTLGDVQFRVDNFLPHTETWPYRAATDRDTLSFPALRLRIKSNMTRGQVKVRWATGNFFAAFRGDEEGWPLRFEMFRLKGDPALVNEFLSPPRPDAQGQDGQLVLALGGALVEHGSHSPTLFRIPVDASQLNQPTAIPGTGITVTITGVTNLMDEFRKAHEGFEGPMPNFPVVKFTLSRSGITGEYLGSARMPERSGFTGEGKEIGDVSCWYHTRDLLWGDKKLMGSFQLLQGPDGKVYYRACGKDGIRGKGKELDVTNQDAEHVIPWKETMKMSFWVSGYLSEAVVGTTYVPRNLDRIGAPAGNLQPAVFGAIVVGNKEYPFQAGSRTGLVDAGNDLYLVRYRQASKPLNFTVKLNRAYDEKDPGTDTASKYHSDITVQPKEGKPFDAELFMNHTLDHDGYRFFQAGYQSTEIQDGDRLVSVSTLTLARDPGLWFKYIGTFLVVLGILTMFYMKAYFFKPRARRGETPADNGVPQPA